MLLDQAQSDKNPVKKETNHEQTFNRQSLLSFLLIFIIVQSLGSSVSAASDSLSNISSEEISKIKANLAEMGVEESTQGELVKKLKKGQPWDSVNPDKQSEGKVEKLTFLNPAGKLVDHTKTTYPDGSVSVMSLEGGTISCVLDIVTTGV